MATNDPTGRQVRPWHERRRGPTRRDFLQVAALASASLASGSGCGGGSGGAGPGDPPRGAQPTPSTCTPDLDSGEFLAVEAFANDGSAPLGVRRGAGLTGNLLYDLSDLSQDSLVTPNSEFFIRTMYPDLIDASREWAIRVHGLVHTERILTLDDLLPAAQDRGVLLTECSGNRQSGSFGLISAAQWAGIPAYDLLNMVTPNPGATRVLVSGFDEHSSPAEGSTPGASWVFTLNELAESFFAVEMNGEPLPDDHGKPVRLFTPGWYGCTCIKWVNEVVFVDDDVPATSQMQEFAERTHQDGVPPLARDYIPAVIDTAAMPVRIERWRLDGGITYRIMGIVWGGDEADLPLSIGIGLEGGEQRWEPVFGCPQRAHHRTWGLWWHHWTPTERGRYRINLSVDDVTVRTRRLDSGWYTRTVDITSI